MVAGKGSKSRQNGRGDSEQMHPPIGYQNVSRCGEKRGKRTRSDVSESWRDREEWRRKPFCNIAMDKWLVGGNRCMVDCVLKSRNEATRTALYRDGAPPGPASMNGTGPQAQASARPNPRGAATSLTAEAISKPRLTRNAQKGVEQRRAIEQLRTARAMKLGMPLHPHDKRRAPVAHGFDDAVRRRYRFDVQIAPERLHRLMMDRVDDRIAPAGEHVHQRRAIRKVNAVAVLLV